LAEPASTAPGAPAAADQARFAELYFQNVTFVWRSLRRLGVREADAADLCQEVFCVVHDKLSEFDGRSPKGWLFVICTRVAAKFRRRASARREHVTNELPEVAVDPDQRDALERKDARELLQSVLDGVDENHRSVFILYELEELTMAEVAKIVGCPLQTAYSRLRAVRRRIEEAARAWEEVG
jgi:RNA polymerase sigma-70 factor (ECF subfamily)